jgi:hypothetical protein
VDCVENTKRPDFVLCEAVHTLLAKARSGYLSEFSAGGLMAEGNDPIICDICRKGHLTLKMEEIAFRQWSDKGYIRCRVTMSVGTCDTCGAKSLPLDSDEIFDAAFQQEYKKLP